MLAGLLYDDVLPFCDNKNHDGGLFPDDIIEILDDFGILCRHMRRLPKHQPALVAIEWLEPKLGGHYVVWDAERTQFLDPLHGLINKGDLMRLCKIEHIWATSRRNMRTLVRARTAKALVEKMFKPFDPTAITTN